MTATRCLVLPLAAAILIGWPAPGLTQPSSQPSSRPSSPADQHVGHRQQPGEPERVQELPSFIPRVTDEDRKAAFPEVEGHATHDRVLHSYTELDQLEWYAGEDAEGFNLDGRGWLGGDRDRFWWRTEGTTEDGAFSDAQVHALYGRQFARWWDVVVGVRQDFRPGDPQTWAAVGVQGLAPLWFNVEATAYVAASGRTQARIAVEYDLLLTNRLVVQPLIEAGFAGQSDPDRGTGAGLSTSDLGFRLRYEIRRELAPYVGVTWNRKWGSTGDFAEGAGQKASGWRFVAGSRLWF